MTVSCQEETHAPQQNSEVIRSPRRRGRATTAAGAVKKLRFGVRPFAQPWRISERTGSHSFSLTHRHRFALGTMLALVEPHGTERERQPTEIVGKAYHQNDPARNRADSGAIGKFR